MTRFYLNPAALDKWMHQNAADYTGDYYEGVLLDNFLLSCKNGVAAVYEHYLNPNASNYLVEFERGRGDAVYDSFISAAVKACDLE